MYQRVMVIRKNMTQGLNTRRINRILLFLHLYFFDIYYDLINLEMENGAMFHDYITIDVLLNM